MRTSGVHRRKVNRNPAREQVDHCRSTALERNMNDVDSGHLAKELPGQMRGRSDPGRAIGELARLAFGERDQLSHAFDAERRRHYEHIRKIHPHGQRCQVFLRVVTDLDQVRGDRQRADRAEQDHRAISRRPRDILMCDVATRTGLVFDHDAQTDIFGQLLGDYPGRMVGRTASRKADDDRQRLVWQVLGLGC